MRDNELWTDTFDLSPRQADIIDRMCDTLISAMLGEISPTFADRRIAKLARRLNRGRKD